MSNITMKALEILQANTEQSEFTNSDLVPYGFSNATTKFIIRELEENGYIVIVNTYVNGNISFRLL